MSSTFVHAFQGEWLKKKRSLASWLVIAGSFFTPAIRHAITTLRL